MEMTHTWFEQRLSVALYVQTIAGNLRVGVVHATTTGAQRATVTKSWRKVNSTAHTLASAWPNCIVERERYKRDH